MTFFRDKNSFNSSFITFRDGTENNQKTISIPIKNRNSQPKLKISKSLDDGYREKSKKRLSTKLSYSPYSPYSPHNEESNLSYRKSHNIAPEKSSNFTSGYHSSIGDDDERGSYDNSPNPRVFNSKINGRYYSPEIAGDVFNNSEFKPYDAVNNCKSAGVIPYAIHDGKVYFLFQQSVNPLRKKDIGWNDFGGKKVDYNESTANTAGREFSEETSCLFYLKENSSELHSKYYNLLKDNPELLYDDKTIDILKNLIPESQKFYSQIITKYVQPIYISSKETYISYFVKVPYIPPEDLPRAEDLHIPYECRYIRECKWFTFEELMALTEKDFHKRLQITRIQQRILKYYNKGLFTQ